MTTFENGPAQGQLLSLRRAPIFLRVTEACGVWDALDRLEDRPRPEETLHAYKLSGETVRAFIRAARGQGGLREFGTYRLVTPQPPEEVMRDQAKWEEWCYAQPK